MLYGPVLLIGALVAGGGWYLFQQYQQRQQATLAASQPKQAPDPLATTYSGKIRAQKPVLIPAPIDGTLESIEAIDGEEVYEGQLLGRIQNSSIETHKQKSEEDLERAKGKLADVESQLLSARLEEGRASADLARTRSEYDTASRAFDRQQKLFREGATARKTFEKSAADLRKLSTDLKDAEETRKRADGRVSALQANVEDARTKLKELTEDLEDADAELLTGEVKAPVAGLLIGHRKSAGEEVTRDIEDLFEIAIDLTAMEIVVELPAEVAKKLKVGSNALLQIAEAGPAPLNGTVREVQEAAAIIEFVSPSPAIRPGMTGQVRFLN